MKKILFTSLLIANLHVILTAQVSIKYGVEAGTTSSLIKSIDDPALEAIQKSTYTAGAGFYVGGVAHFNQGKGFSFQTGLKYVSISAKEKVDFWAVPGIVADGTVKMSFVEIPLNFIFKPVASKNKCVNKFYGFFGPQIGIAMSGHTEFSVTGQPDQHRDLEFGSDTSQYKRVQISFAGGLGYQLSKKMNFQVGYQLGMNDIDNVSNFSTRFGSLKIGLQYFFK